MNGGGGTPRLVLLTGAKKSPGCLISFELLHVWAFRISLSVIKFTLKKINVARQPSWNAHGQLFIGKSKLPLIRMTFLHFIDMYIMSLLESMKTNLFRYVHMSLLESMKTNLFRYVHYVIIGEHED